MFFDLDEPESIRLPEKAGLPEPTVFIINPDNTHAHAGYLLESPVVRGEKARTKPLAFYADVERGFTRRLGADRNYTGLIQKNPFHPRWAAIWTNTRFRLDEMNDLLTPEDKIWTPDEVRDSGKGRNCTLFDTLRKKAYRKLKAAKASGMNRQEFAAMLMEDADALNLSFETPLYFAEVRAVVRSISRFCYERMEGRYAERFRYRQSQKGRKAWSKTPTLSKTKPWEAEGVSRSAWFARRKTLLA